MYDFLKPVSNGVTRQPIAFEKKTGLLEKGQDTREISGFLESIEEEVAIIKGSMISL